LRSEALTAAANVGGYGDYGGDNAQDDTAVYLCGKRRVWKICICGYLRQTTCRTFLNSIVAVINLRPVI